jgi:hypothetical protein
MMAPSAGGVRGCVESTEGTHEARRTRPPRWGPALLALLALLRASDIFEGAESVDGGPFGRPFARKRAADSWAYAEEAAEWPALPETTQASATIDALTPGRGSRFRARARTNAGSGDGSVPVVFLAF